MNYKNYTIEPDNTGYAPKNMVFGIFKEEEYIGSGGTVEECKKMIEKLQAVTQQEVQQVAKQYFDDAHLTVGELDPQPLPNSPRKPSAMPHTPSGLER